MKIIGRIFWLVIIIVGFHIISNSNLFKDSCSIEVNPQANADPDCARKNWGENYYYVTRKIYNEEVLPYQLKAEHFDPGLYTLQTSNNENIVFKVVYNEPFYCGKVKRYLYNHVYSQKPIRILEI